VTLAERVIIVSGASGALGGEVVAALLAAGARVAAPVRDDAGVAGLRGRFGAEAPLLVRRADVTRPEEAAALVEAATEAWGRLDGVACMAGAYAGSGPLHTSPADEWPRMLGANLESVHGLLRAALPHLGRGGSIVTVGARSVESGGAGAAAYVVSKAAVQALTRVLAAENRARGVRVNCVAPGTLDTPQNRAAMPGADPSAWTPLPEVARVILFLLSPDSAPVTGAVVPVDARS
jgi:NAD(P)-dependent dehydrogenase (short-subunit alcohol dehydrogenase family)